MTIEEYKKKKQSNMTIEQYRNFKSDFLNKQTKHTEDLWTSNTPMQSDLNKKTEIQTPTNNETKPSVGSIIGKTLATPVAALGQLGTGVAMGLESAMDFGTTIGVGGINALRNRRIQTIEKELEKLNAQGEGDSQKAKDLQKSMQEAISARDYSNKKTEEFIAKEWVQDSIGKANDEFTDKYSYLPVKVGQITKTVGNMLPSIANAGSIAKSLPQATSKIGQIATKGATMLPFMAQAAGSSTEQALNEGANLADATKYGLASGAIEGAIESISGGIGGSIGGKVLSSKLGKEAVERIAKNALGKYALKLADAGVDVLGEGFEEVLSTAINPFIQRMTYDEQAELATSEEMMQSFIDGVLASLLVKGGQAGLSRVTNRNNANVQENEAQNQTQTQNVEPSNVTLPNQVETAQNVNMEQITQTPNLPTQKAQETLQSAKIAGMTDMDIQKAKELNDMLRSGTRLNFYDEKTIPQNVQADKAKIANGFYKDGTLWINKNSKNKVEQILGHELTHHLETTDSYTDLSNTILDSEVFYDFVAEKGYTNVAEYKNKLKEMGYNDAQLDNELVARFVEEKMFTDQKSIDRLARQNTKLVEKIKNWISDLVVSFKGTAQEKELRRIENMYRKALGQARNTTASAETQFSIAGVKAMNNINDIELRNAYNEAVRMKNNKADNEKIRTKTGWFQDKNGAWKFEFSDKDMKLKDDVQILRDKTYRLEKLLKHDVLFTAYPQLRNYKIEFSKLKDGVDGNHVGLTSTIQIDPDKVRSKADVEGIIIHELQHVIQKIEGFERGASSKKSKLAYYTSLGEIEAADTRRRLELERDNKLNRKEVAPESSKANPKHEGLDNYLSKRTEKDIEKDNKFLQRKGIHLGGIINEESMGTQNTELSAHPIEQVSSMAGDVRRLAGREPAFSMSQTNEQYSMNPVELAKNPPNIETGLDQLKRTKRVKEGDSISNFANNIENQSIFDDKFKDLALNNKNITTYERISNKETLQKANDAINEQGQKWVDRFRDKSDGELKAEDIAGGFILMNRYQEVGDYESMLRIAEKLRKAGTRQGQTIQMFSVLGRMTPEGMTYYAQKELSKAYDEILKNKTQAWADEHADEFKLNDRDIEYIQRRVNQASKLPEGRDKYVLLGEIASRIQNKIPPQPGQSIKALARNSMLLNPKTMVRNVLGNVVIVPNHIVSDFVGTAIDKAISKKTGVRTTGIANAKDMLAGSKKGFYESFDDFRRGISTREVGNDRFEIQNSGRNFNENNTGKLATQRNAVSKALNGLDRVTGYLLESGDRPFYEAWFINSLNNQMKLNNAAEPTAEMIEIATDEALQRTWQDSNTYTKAVTGVRNTLNKFNIKGYGLGDMVMPFVKTPANLTKAVVDFSPLGAVNAALKTSQFAKDMTKGEATSNQQREIVKAWSQVITGTMGMAVMTALANAGILTGGGDDDKDVRAFEQNVLGIKPYSIKIGDKTYTYDWAQPLGTSAAMVADTVKSLKNATDNESKVGALLKGLQSGASVLLEQSFVSSIRNLFEEDNLFNALIEIATNEPSKFTPQVLSQIAQIGDDTARTSYVYNDKLATGVNKVKAKIPGLRQTLEPSVDVLGREVETDNSIGNVMFNPANTAFARTTEGAEEMYRVYQSTGDKAAIAQVAPYYFNVSGEKIVLTPKQRTQYQKTIGKIASDGVENLIYNKAYKALSDTDKAEILKDLYSYGNAIAKEEASTSYLLPSGMVKIKNSGMSPEEYILLKYISGMDGTKKDEMYNALTSAGYSNKETEEFLSYYKGYKFESTSKNTLPTLSSQRAKLPTLKK